MPNGYLPGAAWRAGWLIAGDVCGERAAGKLLRIAGLTAELTAGSMSNLPVAEVMFCGNVD